MLPIPIHDTAVTTKCIARAEKIYRTFYILMHEFLWNGHAAFGCLLLQYQAVLQPPQRRSFGPGDPQFPHHGSFSLFSHLVFALCATILNRLSSRARSILCICSVSPSSVLFVKFFILSYTLVQRFHKRATPTQPSLWLVIGCRKGRGRRYVDEVVWTEDAGYVFLGSSIAV
jgi:hypothetical protein